MPVANDLMSRLREHVKTNKVPPDRPLFPNRQGAALTREGIALWLGHEQPAVTHTYVQADIKMKRECMELLEQPSAPRRKRDPMRFSRLLSFLEAQ